MKEFKVLISALFVLILMACGDKRTDERIVSVTIEPQRYFAEKIAGDKFKINCVVPAGQSPETYDPTPQQMVQVGKSQGYLRIGSIGFEQAWMDNIRNNNPGLKVFDLSEGIDLLKSPEKKRNMITTTIIIPEASIRYVELYLWSEGDRQEHFGCLCVFGPGE